MHWYEETTSTLVLFSRHRSVFVWSRSFVPWAHVCSNDYLCCELTTHTTVNALSNHLAINIYIYSASVKNVNEFIQPSCLSPRPHFAYAFSPFPHIVQWVDSNTNNNKNSSKITNRPTNGGKGFTLLDSCLMLQYLWKRSMPPFAQIEA